MLASIKGAVDRAFTVGVNIIVALIVQLVLKRLRLWAFLDVPLIIIVAFVLRSMCLFACNVIALHQWS